MEAFLVVVRLSGRCELHRKAQNDKYSQLPKSWRNPKNLEISLGEGFCGSRGDAGFSLCLG